MNKTLTALDGVRVGHSTHLDKLTGCTVIVFDKPRVVAYKSYGGSPGTFDTDSLRSGSTAHKRNAIFIAGGSSTGLMTAASVMECLRRDGIGAKDGVICNPALTGAIIYDQGVYIGPYDPACGAEAYESATNQPVQSGNVGAGTGAAVGKLRWIENGSRSGAMKAGVGSARVDLGNGIIVTAMSVVNALGNIVLPNGAILAGNRDGRGGFLTYDNLQDFLTNDRTNTTITVVGINVDLGSVEHYERVAHMASQGQIRAIDPVNTSLDGDTVFVFSTEEIKKPLNHMAQHFRITEDDRFIATDVIGVAAAKAVRESIYDACLQAETVSIPIAHKGVIPSAKEYHAAKQ